MLEKWREQWAVECNRALERAGHVECIDHRSLAEQGSDRLPQVHLGPHSATLERQGIATEKGEHNRLVAEHNAVVVDLEKAREERRQLTAEKAVMERYKARLKVGWHPSHAKAPGQLGYHLGGGELTRGKMVDLLDDHRKQVHALHDQVEAARQEGLRLERVETLLSERD